MSWEIYGTSVLEGCTALSFTAIWSLLCFLKVGRRRGVHAEYLWSERVRHWGLPLRDRFLCSGFFVPAVNRSKGGIDPLVYWLFLAEKRFHLTITPCSDSYCPILGYIKQVTVALWGTVNPPWSTSFAVDLDPVTTDDTGLAINIKNFSDNRTTYDCETFLIQRHSR